MEKVHPEVIQEEARHIPAEVQVPADQIGDVGHRVEGAAHRIAGQRGQTGLIHLMAEVVQHAVVVQHVALVFCGDRDLVGDAPADDAGMVVVLDDQLLHLGDRVLTPVGHMLRDIGDLCPDDHARLIAEIVEILVVLVVCQTDGVRAQLLDELHILVMHFPGDGIAEALAVLMAGNTVQRVGAAVKEEALLRVNMEAAHAKALPHLVLYGSVQHQTHRAGVEIGVAYAVPQMGMRKRDRGVTALAGQHLSPGGIEDRELDLALPLDAGLDGDVCICAVDSRGDLHAAAAQIVQRNVIFADDQQADIAVDAAVEGEVRLLGIDAVVLAVVHRHGQLVLLRQQAGHLCAEGRVAAVMAHDLLTVQRDPCAGVDALKLQPDLLRFSVISGGRKLRCIGAGAAPIIIATVLTVDVVPGMGQIHRSGFAVRPGELPVFHQLGRASHCALLCCILYYKHCTGVQIYSQ